MTAQETISAAVESELERQGLNQSRLAERIGHRPNYVSKKLSGQLRWSVDDLDALSDALGVQLVALLMPPLKRVTRGYRRLRARVTFKYPPLFSRATLVSGAAA